MSNILADKATNTLAGISILFLAIGYMGINVFTIESSSVNAIRMASTIPMILLISTTFENYSITKSALILLAISALSAPRNSISFNIIYIIIFISTFRTIPFLTLARLSSQALGLAIIVSLALVALGITENAVDVSTSFLEQSEDQRERLTFGYRNVNAFAALVSAYCMLIMLQGNNVAARYIFSSVISFTFYLYTDSRTLVASTTLFFLLSIYFNILKKHPKILTISSVLLAITPLVYSIFTPTILNHMPLLDLFLSNRLSLGSAYLEELSPMERLIGGAAPTASLTIDNAILLVMGAIGAPATFYLFVKITQILKNCIANCDYRLYAFLLSFWLLSVSESSLVRPESIICLPFWIAVIFTSGARNRYANTAS